MSCLSALTIDLVSNCTTQGSGGIEVKAWIGQRSDLTATFDNTNPSKVTDLAIATGKQLITLTGVRKGFDGGHDIEITEKRSNRYIHAFDFEAFQMTTAVREQLDGMEDVVVIFERMDKIGTPDGVFQMLGMKFGLDKTADTRRENNANGARAISLASMAGMGEPYSSYTFLKTDYATTKALLVTLETPA